MKNSYKFKCKRCGNSMSKEGKTPQGKQRYKCTKCNTRTIVKNKYKTKQNELKLFAKWVTDSTKVIDKVDMSRRTFYRKTNWCWGVVPKIKSDEISSDFIFIDATYISNELFLLIVRNKKHVLGFKWAKSETYEDYFELLETLPEPSFVICDGHKSIIKAVKKIWKNSGIQRCLVHIIHLSERKLGKRSPFEMNHTFRKHIKKITTIDTIRKADNWLKKFETLYEKHKDFIEEKSPIFNIGTGEILRFYNKHKNLYSILFMVI